MSKITADALIPCVRDYLKRQGLVFNYSEELKGFGFGMELKNDRGVAGVAAVCGDDSLIAFCTSPLHIRDERRNDVAEFLHRVNMNMLFGCLQFDIDKGSVRYMAYSRLCGVMPDDSTLASIMMAFRVIDDTEPLLEAVDKGEISPSSSHRHELKSFKFTAHCAVNLTNLVHVSAIIRIDYNSLLNA